MRRSLCLWTASLFVALAACSSSSSTDDKDDDKSNPTTGTDDTGGASDPDPSTPTDGGSTAPGPSDDASSTDGTTTVRVHYPVGTHRLAIIGDAPLAWKATKPMIDKGNDTWEYPLGVIAAPVQFQPTLDDGPAHGLKYTAVPGHDIDIYPHFVETVGSVSVQWPKFKSKNLTDPATRAIRVYLPPGYKENTLARYPVVYMPDGQGMFGDDKLNATLFQNLQAADVMNAGVEATKEDSAIAPAILVAIDTAVNGIVNTARMQELTPTADDAQVPGSGKGVQYMKMLVEELKPMVDTELRTRPEREFTYMYGQSLGGLMAVWAGAHYPAVFGGVIGQSPSVWWDKRKVVGELLPFGPGAPLIVYTDVGDAEDGNNGTDQVAANAALTKAYIDKGYVEGKTLMTVVEKGGTHDTAHWHGRLPGALHFALGTGR